MTSAMLDPCPVHARASDEMAVAVGDLHERFGLDVPLWPCSAELERPAE
jgi:hypothetical protein